jgi:NhaP-type Na+/H+ or K+/H+ antiporter
MPTQVVSVLEGESLVNDATALTALRAAIIAIGGTVTVLEAGTDFVIAAAGGIAVGLVVALVFIPIRKRTNNPSFDTVVTFTIPYVAYLPAEQIHASGVLAVVVTGLVIGHKAPLLASGTRRLTSESNLRTVGFILENAVFLMIGLQLRGLLENVGADDMPLGMVVVACVSVFLVAVVARFVWVYLGAALLRLTRRPDRLSWSMRTVIAWAGMRGVVTLAAALALPIDFPSRGLVIVVAVVIVVASILIQGLSLPWLVKPLRLQAPDPGQLALQEAAMLDQARIAGLARLDELTTETADSPDVIERLRARTELRSDDEWERAGRASHGGETPLQEYQRLRLDMLMAEREAVLAARSNGTADEEIVRRVIRVLDVEEAMLDQPSDQEIERQSDLVVADERGEGCEHLEQFRDIPEPAAVTAGQCGACLTEGTKWVSLRMCLTCGNVACCDSSSGRHAERHHHETEHPVMRARNPAKRGGGAISIASSASAHTGTSL